VKRAKIAVAIAAITFLILAGATSASAFWSASASVVSTVKVASLADSCSSVTSVQNASFELPVITQSWIYIPNGGVPGWTSTDPSGIEIWQSGFNGVVAPVGNQFVELNATTNATLSQSIASTPGQILQWSLLHRGRAGVDTMQLLIGSSASNLVAIRTISDGTSAWGRYSGAYVVPAGQTSTYLAFRAISTATGDLSVGNFMDDVSFGSGPCLTAASTVSNLTTPGSTVYHTGDLVQYSTQVANIGSALSYKSTLSAPLPSSLTYKAGTLKIDSASESDAAGDDLAEYTTGSGGTGTITARLGLNATAAAGGTIAQSSSTTVTFQAVVTGAVGTVIHYTPTANYANGLASQWVATSVVAADVPISVVAGPDVGMSATTPSPATLTAGVTTPSTWSFTAKNNDGSAIATGVVVHVTTPTGYVSTTAPAITGGAACTITSSTTADCTIGSLAAGVSKIITMHGYAAVGTSPGALSIVATVTSTSGDSVASNDSATGTATVVADTAPPGNVTNLAASGTTGSQTTLTWTAPTDNVGVTGYDIYRGGVLIASVANVTTFTNTLLTPSTTYTYTVKAKDAAGNVSALFSNTVTVKTSATFTSGVYYRVSYPGDTWCIGTSASPAVTGSALQLAACDTTSSQKWDFLSSLNGVNPPTGNFLMAPDITNTTLGWNVIGSSNVSGAKIDVTTVTGMAQEWKPVVDAGGTFHFINRNSAKCLDVNGNLPSAGLQLQQVTCNGSAAQSFTLTGVAP
jgi:hypothetical protein